jgi:hypothetical protein
VYKIVKIIKNNNSDLGYLSHIVNMGHEYGTIRGTQNKWKTLKHIT